LVTAKREIVRSSTYTQKQCYVKRRLFYIFFMHYSAALVKMYDKSHGIVPFDINFYYFVGIVCSNCMQAMLEARLLISDGPLTVKNVVSSASIFCNGNHKRHILSKFLKVIFHKGL
jgi:hypothetical protein